MRHINKLLLGLVLAVWAGSAAAQDACDRRGHPGCFAHQMITLAATEQLNRALWKNPGRSGSIGLDRFERGLNSPSGSVCMYLYVYLRPESAAAARAGTWRMPGHAVREIRYDGNGDPTFHAATFITNKTNVPEVLDARINRGQWVEPHYVLKGSGGSAGIGWSIPKALLSHVWFTMMCPCSAVTTFPDRVNARQGMILYPEDITRAIREDREYTLQSMAVVTR